MTKFKPVLAEPEIGFFSGSEYAGLVEADIITLAKSLGSGIPVGACLVNDRLSENLKNGDLGTTFGGGMIAMAAVSATIEAIENDGMIQNAREIEEYLREQLNDVEEIIGVHGKGCLLGLEFRDDCISAHKKLLEHRVITGLSSDKRVLRLLMPLCVKREEIDLLIEILRK